jgi:hypothetical protein
VDDVFYRLDEGNLYSYSKLFIITQLTSPEIGFKIESYLIGSGSGYSIGELGLFLIDNDENETIFSRLTFEPIPVSGGNTYEITYYIYF